MKVKVKPEEPSTATINLLDKVRHIHPNLQFCGEPRNAILNISDELLHYILALIKGVPLSAPKVSANEWEELFHILRSHWVLPLLYWQVRRLSGEFLPPKPFLKNLRASFQRSRMRCFDMEKQLREIVGAFNDEGVRVLVLKGPAYGRTIYDDPVLRPASDLDLLVKPDDMEQSRAILEGLGYRCKARIFDAEKETLYKDEKLVHRGNPRHYRAIELHWRLHNFLGISQEAQTEELFRRAIKVETDSLSFEVLDSVDAFIHTAINNAYGHDDAMRLIWAYDIKMLALSLAVPSDWEKLQKRSVAWSARLAVELSIEMARAWLDLQLPKGFNDFSKWPKPTDSEVDGWRKLISRNNRFLTLLSLRMPPSSGAVEKARLFARLVFPLRDKVCMDYPPPHPLLFPLSYVYRWWHWVKKLTRTSPKQRNKELE